MSKMQLPGGGKAWFVRTRKGRHCGLRPVSNEGRLLTVVYAAWISGVTWFLAGLDLSAAMLVAWLAAVSAATLLYIVTALRMAAPAPPAGRGSC